MDTLKQVRTFKAYHYAQVARLNLLEDGYNHDYEVEQHLKAWIGLISREQELEALESMTIEEAANILQFR